MNSHWSDLKPRKRLIPWRGWIIRKRSAFKDWVSDYLANKEAKQKHIQNVNRLRSMRMMSEMLKNGSIKTFNGRVEQSG